MRNLTPEPNNIEHISSLWAYVSFDEGGEGLVARGTPLGVMPLIAANETLIRSYREFAKEIAKTTGKKVRLVKFTMREDMEILEP